MSAFVPSLVIEGGDDGSGYAVAGVQENDPEYAMMLVIAANSGAASGVVDDIVVENRSPDRSKIDCIESAARPTGVGYEDYPQGSGELVDTSVFRPSLMVVSEAEFEAYLRASGVSWNEASTKSAGEFFELNSQLHIATRGELMGMYDDMVESYVRV